MTLAEKWKQEGVQQGVLQGLYEGIELALIVKFGSTPEKDRLLDLIKNGQSVDRLKQIKSAILEVETMTELIERLFKATVKKFLSSALKNPPGYRQSFTQRPHSACADKTDRIRPHATFRRWSDCRYFFCQRAYTGYPEHTGL